MSRPLRVGDRVTATGTVVETWSPLGSRVMFDGAESPLTFGTPMSAAALTLIAPAEPPVGSVVVKDGVAYTRGRGIWMTPGRAPIFLWSDLSDGDVIFRAGGDE